MKEFLFLVLFIFLNPLFSFGYVNLDKINSIDLDTNECINKTYKENGNIKKCATIGIKKYDLEIKKTLVKAKTNLEINQYNQLLKTQKSWEKYIQDFDKLYDEFYKKNCSKDFSDFCSENAKYQLHKKHVIELSNFFDDIKVIDKNTK